MMTKVRGALAEIKGKKSVGIIERDEKRGLLKVAKPVGVIAGIIPCTNPEATPVIKAIYAIKGRNAIIFSPHPRTKKTNLYITNLMREVLKECDAPEDLILSIKEPTMDISNLLMKEVDLVLATGGSGLVRSAYSSGTPAYGVGQGNAVSVIDETADLKDAANKIMRSKTFDYATSCSTENSCVIQESIYDEFVENLQEEGGYFIKNKTEEKEKLLKAMWTDGHLSKKIIAQSAQTIAKEAEIDLPESKTFFMIEETGIGADYLFSGEKLSVVTTLYKYKEFEEAIDKVNAITSYQGRGHSCGIHSFNQKHIEELALKTKTSRIMVRQPQCLANSGAWTNGMPMTLTLGCGTWGGNISSENITWKHLINVTWVATPIENTMPSDEELFEKFIEQD